MIGFTASEHPAKWKFDFPIYHPPDLAAWRAWLTANHDTVRGVWVASWRKASGRIPVAYADLVEEALCFGWIDSTVNILDDARGLQLMPRDRQRSPARDPHETDRTIVADAASGRRAQG